MVEKRFLRSYDDDVLNFFHFGVVAVFNIESGRGSSIQVESGSYVEAD